MTHRATEQPRVGTVPGFENRAALRGQTGQRTGQPLNVNRAANRADTNRASSEHTNRASHGEALMSWQLRAAGLPDPIAEYRFAPPRRWRFDFAWPSELVAVEIEGGSWAGGRHTRGAGFEADCEKYAAAVVGGWRVLRVTTGMVEDGRALAWVGQLLRVAP